MTTNAESTTVGSMTMITQVKQAIPVVYKSPVVIERMGAREEVQLNDDEKEIPQKQVAYFTPFTREILNSNDLNSIPIKENGASQLKGTEALDQAKGVARRDEEFSWIALKSCADVRKGKEERRPGTIS